MSGAILTNNDIAALMEMHSETGHLPNFWKNAARAFNKTADQLQYAVRDRKRHGMYKRERGPVIDLTPIEFFNDDDYPVIQEQKNEND